MRPLIQRIVTVLGIAVLTTALAGSVQAGEKKAAKRDQQAFEGVVTALDLKASTITLKKKDGTMTFQVPADCKIFVERIKEAAKLSNLKAGDKVEVFYVEQDGNLIAHRLAEKGAGADKKEKHLE